MALDTVLIVGAGPTGLALAISLAKNGIPLRIIDKKLQHTIGQRGSGVQPRTFEIYNFLGVLPEILAATMSPQPLVLYNADGVTIKTELDMAQDVESTPSKPYINARLIGQYKHEELLRAHLAKSGNQVELGVELVSFEQLPDRVVAHIIEHSGNAVDKKSTIEVGWIVGADGAQSVVRHQLGLTFLGESRQEQLIVGDIRIKNSPLDGTKWHMWGDASIRMITLRPYATKGDDRYYTVAAGTLLDRQKAASSREAYIEEFKEISGRNDIEFGDLIWLSHLRLNIRMVNKFGEGRAFVAGDAAHIHSPSGGQGLNTGVQDAFNLAWKLSHVIKGLSPPSLLDSYTAERLPVVAAMLSETTAILKKTFDSSANNLEGYQRGWELRQFGVNYRGSDIVLDEGDKSEVVDPYRSGDDGRVRGGDRAPDAPGLLAKDGTRTSVFELLDSRRHTILLFGSSTADEAFHVDFPEEVVYLVSIYPKDTPNGRLGLRDVIDVEGHAYTGYAVAEGEAVIVRPDGVIGARVRDADGIKKYFGKVLL